MFASRTPLLTAALAAACAYAPGISHAADAAPPARHAKSFERFIEPCAKGRVVLERLIKSAGPGGYEDAVLDEATTPSAEYYFACLSGRGNPSPCAIFEGAGGALADSYGSCRATALKLRLVSAVFHGGDVNGLCRATLRLSGGPRLTEKESSAFCETYADVARRGGGQAACRRLVDAGNLPAKELEGCVEELAFADRPRCSELTKAHQRYGCEQFSGLVAALRSAAPESCAENTLCRALTRGGPRTCLPYRDEAVRSFCAPMSQARLEPEAGTKSASNRSRRKQFKAGDVMPESEMSPKERDRMLRLRTADQKKSEAAKKAADNRTQRKPGELMPESEMDPKEKDATVRKRALEREKSIASKLEADRKRLGLEPGAPLPKPKTGSMEREETRQKEALATEKSERAKPAGRKQFKPGAPMPESEMDAPSRERQSARRKEDEAKSFALKLAADEQRQKEFALKASLREKAEKERDARSKLNKRFKKGEPMTDDGQKENKNAPTKTGL